MTQHHFDTLDGWHVISGWDSPLQHFFIMISKECRCINVDDEDYLCYEKGCQGGDIFLYNNIDDRDNDEMLGGMTLERVEVILNEYLTEYPEFLMFYLQQDKSTDAGNRIYQYDRIGRAKKNPM